MVGSYRLKGFTRGSIKDDQGGCVATQDAYNNDIDQADDKARLCKSPLVVVRQ